jgi:hypothetical protein
MKKLQFLIFKAQWLCQSGSWLPPQRVGSPSGELAIFQIEKAKKEALSRYWFGDDDPGVYF